MDWQVTNITWIHAITAIISLQLVFTVYNTQQIRGRVPFLWMMGLSAFWSFILTFESAAPSIASKIRWSQFEYIANMGIPVMFLLFILSYDLDKPGILKKKFVLFWVVPILTIFLVFTNQFHHLIWTGFSWSPAGHNILIYHHGPVFFVAMAYSMTLIFLGNIILIRYFRNRPGYYKNRGRVLLTGSLCALLTGLVYTLGLSPLEGLDISPMGTLFSGLIFFWGIARKQFFDIVPFSQQLMIEKLEDGVIVLDNRNYIMDISPVSLKLLNIEGQVTGRKIDDVLPALLPVIQGKLLDQESRTEVNIESKGIGWFEVSRYPISTPGAKFLGTMVILHDINHRKRNEFQLRMLAEELTELNRMKDRIYSIISHDLRNPFNSILGFSQLLVDSYDEFTEAERRQFAVNIMNASKGAFNLLENMLEWSLMQLGKFDYSPQTLFLGRLAAESFSLLKLMADKKKIALVNSVSPDQVVFADSNMLAAVLRNLFSNAIKFTPVGGQIEISAITREEQVEVTVTDNGVGMSAEIVKGLFKPDSMRSKQGTENEKGTGLGLLLSKDFIEKHNGSIRVFSEPGKGSRFIFTLPLT